MDINVVVIGMVLEVNIQDIVVLEISKIFDDIVF